jgi:hypothetical protein
MKKLYLFLFIITNVFLSSCGGKLNNDKALEVLNQELPLDTALQTSKIYFQNLNLNYLAQINIIKLKPQQLISTVAGEDGLGVPVQSQNSWSDYDLTEKGKTLVVNQDLANNMLTVKSYFIANYKVKTIYFETDGSNQAEVEFEVAYALTPFSGFNVELQSSMTGAPDNNGNEVYEYNYRVTYFKSVKCTFKKFDTGWGIDDKDQVLSQIKSLNDVKLDDTKSKGVITITSVVKIKSNK